MAVNVHSVTTHNDQYITYEVFVGGKRKWIRTVYFKNDKRHRAGGPAFVEAARDQEAQAKKLLGEIS